MTYRCYIKVILPSGESISTHPVSDVTKQDITDAYKRMLKIFTTTNTFNVGDGLVIIPPDIMQHSVIKFIVEPLVDNIFDESDIELIPDMLDDIINNYATNKGKNYSYR